MSESEAKISQEAAERFHNSAALYASGVVSQMEAIPLTYVFRVAVGMHVSASSAASGEVSREDFLEQMGFWFDRYSEEATRQRAAAAALATARSAGEQPC